MNYTLKMILLIHLKNTWVNKIKQKALSIPISQYEKLLLHTFNFPLYSLVYDIQLPIVLL